MSKAITKFNQVMPFVEFHEGGFAKIEGDPGKDTWYGISQRAHPVDQYPDFWMSPTPAKARQIYRREYWNANNLNLLPLHIAAIAFDMFVNHNPRDAVKVLQRAAGGLKIDGKMGAKTRAKLNRSSISIPRIIQHRLALYDAIVRRRPKQANSLNGWRWRSSCLALYATGLQAGINIKPDGRLAGS